uniref:Chorion peroxidase n=1 Tax=Panagrellus redivivus TaxID=6233 RepID=A0A7E4VCM2_PANRE
MVSTHFATIVYFCILFALIKCDDSDHHARFKRSNFACGKSFVACTSAIVASGVENNEIDAIDADILGLESIGTNKVTLAHRDSVVRTVFKNVDRNDVQSAAQNAVNSINILYNQTERRLYQDVRQNPVQYSTGQWAQLTKTDKYAKEISFSALVSISATQQIQRNGLTPEQVLLGLPEMPIKNSVIQNACPINTIAECIPGKYRSYSGHCNNVNKPLWGAKYEPMQRLQNPAYSDGVSQPRSGLTSSPLPSPRVLSRKLITESRPNHSVCSLFLAHWAQFIYEDIAQVGSTQLFNGEDRIPIPCCSVSHPECYNIGTDGDDPLFRNRALCMPYSRSFSTPRENCSLGVREQGNMVSSFLDGSNVYGSTKEQAASLRSYQNGLLKHRSQASKLELLPPATEKTCTSTNANQPCFASGSEWTNLLPTTTAIHTLWMRQHNRLARQLKSLNPHWDDERLYQESRRIVAAQLQHITYNEFLPIIIGKEHLRSFGVQLQHHTYDSNYNLEANPSVLNEYASTVGLFFFSLLPDSLGLTDKNGRTTNERFISNLLNDPSHLYQRGRMESLLRTIMTQPIRKPGLHMSLELREKFLRGTNDSGIDLAALIIQMGRDHGVNSYSSWREYCGLSRPTDFVDIEALFLDSINVNEMATHYASVDDIDLFIGGLAEKPLQGALVGPTFACILGRQFERTRRGDRFWYENFFKPSAFNEEQLAELRKVTLAEIICGNTDDIGQVQPSVFQVPDLYGNCPMDCNTTVIEKMDLKYWIDQEPKLALPITKQTLEKALKLGAQQYQRLQQAEAQQISRASAGQSRDGSSALSAHSSLMAPKKESLDIARTAAVLRETTKVLLRGDGLGDDEKLPAELDVATLQRLLPEVDVSKIIGNITDFLGPNANNRQCLPQPLPCDHTTKYRSISGWCNNLKFPHYGNAFAPLRRLLDPAYDDGFDSPRTRGKFGRGLPSARKISNAVHTDAPVFHVKFSHMLMQLGQIIDHDMTHSPIARGPNNTILNCSRCDSYDTLSIHCFPITIDANDPFFPNTHNDGSPRCMPFARSLLGQVTLGYRNQINQLTSFLDASYLYGSTECEANHLRLFSQGKMNFTNLGYNKEALPQGPQERDCRTKPKHPCFTAGDDRNNEQPGITVLHTIFLREHNRIASSLHKINNFWTDEQLFQESRRIMSAKMQHVIYNEWLPVILGCETMARYDLTPKKTGYYEEYNDNCDASISQEMSTAAFRFGHTLIRNHFPRLNSFYKKSSSPIDLKVTFNNASVLYDEAGGHLESMLMGLLGAAGMEYDRHIVDAVRNHLFQKPGGPLTGLDLPAINIQRGRDHGIQPYNAYREMCGLRKANTFDDLLDTMDKSAVDAFKSVYAHVDDIDLFPGLMSEKALKGALVGPMLACLIAEQMQRLKRCDRFYYENNNPVTRFTPAQLAEIRKTTFSKILCENSQYAHRIQPNAFLLPDELTNAPMRCNEMPDTDYYEWLDRQFCVVNQRVIDLGKTKRITPCITCTCTTEGTQCHSVTVERCEDLAKNYLFSEIQQDTVCVIQCSTMLRNRSGRL